MEVAVLASDKCTANKKHKRQKRRQHLLCCSFARMLAPGRVQRLLRLLLHTFLLRLQPTVLLEAMHNPGRLGQSVARTAGYISEEPSYTHIAWLLLCLLSQLLLPISLYFQYQLTPPLGRPQRGHHEGFRGCHTHKGHYDSLDRHCCQDPWCRL